MKMLLHCKECIAYAQASDKRLKHYPATVCDGSIYKFRCDRGHEVTVVTTNPRHEILFDIAANAIVDGYFREAVTSFHAALERFREFYIRVALRESGLTKSKETDLWKHVKNQSERQYGAYMFVRAMFSSSDPTLLDNNQVEFRNAVVHKGKIPSEHEAIQAGEAVWKCINPDHEELRDLFSSDPLNAPAQILEEIKEEILSGLEVKPTMITRNIGTFCMKPNEKSRCLTDTLEICRLVRGVR